MTLERRKRLVSKPKGKGNEGEREVIQLLREHGWGFARRNFASGGQGGADIINGPADTSWEVKRCEQARIWAWLEQAKAAARPTETPVVAFRRSYGDWHVAIPLDEYLSLLRLREFG